ncbi:MAG: nucleotide disphospho-sugar-binding domain-containing protein [Planctomycetota bacterium]
MTTVLAVGLPDLGHLLPTLAVLDVLRNRGHRVLVATISDRESLVREAGFEPRLLARETLPIGWLPALDQARAAARTGADLNRLSLSRFTIPLAAAILNDLGSLIRSAAPDRILVDPYCYGAASHAEAAGIPAAGIDGALSAERIDACHDPFRPWHVQQRPPGSRHRLISRLIGSSSDRAMRQVLRPLNIWRHRNGLSRLSSVFDECAGLDRVCPQPASFELPERRRNPRIHYCGAFLAPHLRRRAPFPWERLDGRPLVYAAAGTISRNQLPLLELTAWACSDLPVQLAFGLGSADASLAVALLPGDPIVVPWAPQLELLERAAVCVTHGGLNTTLEALWHGVPLLATPICFDQPGVAARIQASGCGLVVPPDEATPERLREDLQRILSDPAFADRAGELGAEMRETGGASAAADKIEQILA